MQEKKRATGWFCHLVFNVLCKVFSLLHHLSELHWIISVEFQPIIRSVLFLVHFYLLQINCAFTSVRHLWELLCLPHRKHQWPLILMAQFLPWDKTLEVAFRPFWNSFWNAHMLCKKAVQILCICAWSKQNTFSLEFASAWLPTQWAQDYFVKRTKASKGLHFQKPITRK